VFTHKTKHHRCTQHLSYSEGKQCPAGTLQSGQSKGTKCLLCAQQSKGKECPSCTQQSNPLGKAKLPFMDTAVQLGKRQRMPFVDTAIGKRCRQTGEHPHLPSMMSLSSQHTCPASKSPLTGTQLSPDGGHRPQDCKSSLSSGICRASLPAFPPPYTPEPPSLTTIVAAAAKGQ